MNLSLPFWCKRFALQAVVWSLAILAIIAINVGLIYPASRWLFADGWQWMPLERWVNSTSTAGISGIAGNTAVRSTDAQTGLKPIFDAAKVQREIDAQTEITQAFGKEASKAVGDYAQVQQGKALSLKAQATAKAQAGDESGAALLDAQAQAIEDNWGEKGALRVGAHTLIGALTGGVGGAAGAAAGTLTAPLVADALRNAGIDGPLASTLTALASTAAGALAGGNAGAAAGLNEVVNNFLSHDERTLLNKSKSACYIDKSAVACSTANALERKDQSSDRLLANAVASCKGSECNDVSNYIRAQLAQQGCTAPGACPDYATLSKFWTVAQTKAQGLEAVYPEGWLLDAKAIVDLGKFGVRLALGAGNGAANSLAALGQLGRVDAQAVARVESGVGANGGVVAGTAGDSLAVVAKPTYVFRGDGRPPAQIFDEGFKASGTNTDLFNHATTNTNSGLISTSSTPNVAREFADMQVGGYVYTVRKPPQTLDVNATLGTKSPYPQEFEIAVPGVIRPQDILGARQVRADGKFIGPFVKNRGFQP